MRKIIRRLAMLGAAAALAVFVPSDTWSEEGENDGEGSGAKVPSSECVSGLKWTGGDEGSPQMHPGRGCIACHAQGEGPRFIAAGTVFRQIDEPDDCFGVPGVVVLLTDASGKVFRMTTNQAGNFMLRQRGNVISFPLHARLQFMGKERRMLGPKQTANCASCHTSTGENGAPGRMMAPSAAAARTAPAPGEPTLSPRQTRALR
jgi:hypothetical protein